MNFILILFLLDSLMFGYAPKPRLRRVPQRLETSSQLPVAPAPPPSPCVDSGNGEISCFPIDDSDKRYGR